MGSYRSLGIACVVSFAVTAGFVRPALAADPEPSAAEQEQKSKAQKAFDDGSKLFDGRKYAQALTAFQASYAAVPSPNSHLMMARCLRELSKPADAYREYLAVAKEARDKGPRYESTARAADEEREELKTKIAMLTVKLAAPPDGATFKLNGNPIEPAAFNEEMIVEPGTVVITGESPDGATAKAEATVSVGSVATVELKFGEPPAVAPPPPPPPKPVVAQASTSGLPLRTLAYVAGGVGVLGLGAFGVVGSMSTSKYNDLKDKCTAGCPPGSQDDIDSGKQLQTFANIGLIVGAVGIGAGATLFVLSLGKDKPKDEQTASTLSLSVGPGSISLKGAL